METQICTNILLNPDQDPDKLLYYNRVLTAEPSNIKEKYKKIPKRGSHYQVPARYDFSNDPNADIFILYFAIANINLFVIAIKEISVALIISDSPSSTVTTFENPTQDQEVAIAAYNALNETLKGLWKPPNPAYFNLQEYLDYIPQGYPATEEELDGIDNYQQLVDNALEEQKFVYIRLLCKISFMFFVDIDIGFVMENWQDDEPNRWLLVGQLAIEFAGLLYDCVVRTELDFDRRQHRHLEGEEYHRALTSAGLNGANFDIKCSTSCVACNEVTEFFIVSSEEVILSMVVIGVLIWIRLNYILSLYLSDRILEKQCTMVCRTLADEPGIKL